VYVYEIITDWKVEETKAIKIPRNEDIKILLFADDQVLMPDSEGALQISVHKLETVAARCGRRMSTSKTKKWLLKEVIQ
jgi:hypothetical protein